MNAGKRPAPSPNTAADLTHSAVFAPLGVGLALHTNCADVLNAARAAFAPWASLPAPARPHALRLDVAVHPGVEQDEPAAPWIVRTLGATFLAGSGANLLTAQSDRGYALACITPSLTADTERLSGDVIERLALLLAARHDRTPLQAVAVQRAGSAVLLVGLPGADTATLAYACLNAGFTLLAAETVYVSLADGLRVWGNPNRIALPPGAALRFTELSDLPLRVAPGGTPCIVAPLRPEQRAAHPAEYVRVCLVEPAPGRASHLEPLAPEQAQMHLLPPHEAGLTATAAQPAVAALTAQRAYHLAAGSDHRSAVALLRHLTEP
jgi:hypothetical protein